MEGRPFLGKPHREAVGACSGPGFDPALSRSIRFLQRETEEGKQDFVASFNEFQQFLVQQEHLLLTRFQKLKDEIVKQSHESMAKFFDDIASCDRITQELEEKCQQPTYDFLQVSLCRTQPRLPSSGRQILSICVAHRSSLHGFGHHHPVPQSSAYCSVEAPLHFEANQLAGMLWAVPECCVARCPNAVAQSVPVSQSTSKCRGIFMEQGWDAGVMSFAITALH